MNKRIWKFNLTMADRQIIGMPKGSEILSLQTQFNEPCIWVLITDGDDMEDRTFEIFPTGNTIYFDMGIERKSIGTFQVDNGNYIFHVFERLN